MHALRSDAYIRRQPPTGTARAQLPHPTVLGDSGSLAVRDTEATSFGRSLDEQATLDQQAKIVTAKRGPEG